MSDELRDEYQSDYGRAKPNRFAAGMKKAGRLVALDPKAAAVDGTDSLEFNPLVGPQP